MTIRPLPLKYRLLPDNATCVFKGQIFDVYQWEQEMYDGSFATYEMLKRPDTVSIFAIDEGKVIVLDEEQAGGIVRSNSLPAGRVDPTDKTVLEAAQRELREETGLEFRDWTLIQITQREQKIEWFWYMFVAQHKTGQRAVHFDPGEKISMKHMDYEELKKSHYAFFRHIDLFVASATLEEFVAGIKEAETSTIQQ